MTIREMPKKAVSADGTELAYEVIGDGPPLVLVVGAFNDRTTGEPLANALAEMFSVAVYDRRGRGNSGDAQPYAVDREIEDLAAILHAVGGEPAVFGFSAGAALAFRAAAAKVPMRKLVLFGTPFITDATRAPLPPDLAERVRSLVEMDRRGKAVELFQRDAIGLPEPLIAQLRHAPFRPRLEAMAHTLFYDLSIIDGPPAPLSLAPYIGPPTLVLAGADSPPWICNTAERLASALPCGQHLRIAGLAQDLDPQLLAGPVTAFLKTK